MTNHSGSCFVSLLFCFLRHILLVCPSDLLQWCTSFSNVLLSKWRQVQPLRKSILLDHSGQMSAKSFWISFDSHVASSQNKENPLDDLENFNKFLRQQNLLRGQFEKHFSRTHPLLLLPLFLATFLRLLHYSRRGTPRNLHPHAPSLRCRSKCCKHQ